MFDGVCVGVFGYFVGCYLMVVVVYACWCLTVMMVFVGIFGYFGVGCSLMVTVDVCVS